MVVNGVRSSWEASATNRRWVSSEAARVLWDAWSWASISLKVSASWPTSSSDGGNSTRRLKSRDAPIARTACASRSSGASAAPASARPATAATARLVTPPPINRKRSRAIVLSI